MNTELPPAIRLAAAFRNGSDWGAKPVAEDARGVRVCRTKTSLASADGVLVVATFDAIPAATIAATQVCTEKMLTDKTSMPYILDPEMKEIRSFGRAAAPNDAALAAAIAARGAKKFADDLKEDGFKLEADLPPPGPEELLSLSVSKPMMPLMKPREFECRLQPPVLLNDAQCAAANVKPGTWACGALPSAIVPKTSGCVRGVMPRYGLFIEPSANGAGCTVTEVAVCDFCGSIPSVLLGSFDQLSLHSFDMIEYVSKEMLKENGGNVVTPQDVIDWDESQR